jgi:hypothetical protein
MKTEKLIVLFFVLITGFSNKDKLIAQDVKVDLISLEVVNKKLEINYNFVKSKKTQRFNVWVEITNSTGEKLNARALSGDIGDNLMGGEGKKIFWDYNADGVVINEEIEVEVKATVSTVKGAVNTGGAFARSLLMPGWGLSYIDQGKPYWLIGVAGYACLGSSLYLNSSSNSNYDKYLNSTNPDEINSYFNKSQSQRSTSKALAVAAIGTWSFSMVWTLVKATKKNKSLTTMNWQNNLRFFSKVDPWSKTTIFALQYKF